MNINEWNGWIPSFAKPVAVLLLSLVVFASVQGREDIKSDVDGFGKASNRCSKSTVWTVMVPISKKGYAFG